MAAAKKPAAKRKANGYSMPDPLPAGEVIQDLYKKQWRLGPPIGKGGFGEIYSAQEVTSKSSKEYPYVLKIEPHSNGPLFVEMHFYTRNGKQADIDAYKSSKKLKSLGMPAYVASGSHQHNSTKYRFIVMEKFATDIWKLYLANKKSFPPITVFRLGLQILDVLEYMHNRGYVHADIKGANILVSEKNPNQAYLVDFGLASRFTTETTFKPNPNKMHDGTIEYLSRDAHQGVQTRRGDLEILVYNLIHWLGGVLPWESNLKDPKVVQASKEKHMATIDAFLKSAFGTTKPPDCIPNLLKYVNELKFNEEPNYDKVRSLLLDDLKKAGGTASSPLVFTTGATKKTPVKRKAPAKATKTPEKKPRSTRRKSDSETQVNGTEEVVDENKKPSKRTRRVNTIQNGAVEEVMTAEMLRIKNMVTQRKGTSKRSPAVAKKKPKTSSDEEDEPLQKRRLPRAVKR